MGQRMHGLSKHPLFGVWKSMRGRCFDESCVTWKYYGGRGITVCDEWAASFEAFYAFAMANGWKSGLQIDRIDNDGPYSPDNCRLVSAHENSINRRPARSGLPVGVYRSGRRFMARVQLDGKRFYLGSYDTPEEAEEQYRKALAVHGVRLR